MWQRLWSILEKEWGSIDPHSYSEHVISQIYEYLQAHPDLQFLQDNGPGHGTRFTHEQFQEHGIYPVFWPPFSLDLSPIETIWDQLKNILDKQHPEIHRNYKRLQAVWVGEVVSPICCQAWSVV